MNTHAPPATWYLATPAAATGAVAIIVIRGDLAWFFDACGFAPVAYGAMGLRTLFGIDRALVSRLGQEELQLLPHGGTAVVRAILRGLVERGVHESPTLDARRQFPEARDELEARMLSALSVAASPRAVDLLLAQPALWSRREMPANLDLVEQTARDRVLRRLIDPPLVAAIGPANVGKSTLINRLANRSVSIVADMPGTTRDHVGVYLDVDGLVIRYMDTPGVRVTQDPIEAQAIELAFFAVTRADLILHLGDITAAPPRLPPDLAAIPRLTVHTRADLGVGAFAFDLQTRSLEKQEFAELSQIASAIRAALVPDEMLQDPTPWRFWP